MAAEALHGVRRRDAQIVSKHAGGSSGYGGTGIRCGNPGPGAALPGAILCVKGSGGGLFKPTGGEIGWNRAFFAYFLFILTNLHNFCSSKVARDLASLRPARPRRIKAGFAISCDF